MAEGGVCTCGSAKKKNGMFKWIGFGKKKKKKPSTEPTDCYACIQENADTSHYSTIQYKDPQQLISESNRKDNINPSSSYHSIESYKEKDRILMTEARNKQDSSYHPQESVPPMNRARICSAQSERALLAAGGDRVPRPSAYCDCEQCTQSRYEDNYLAMDAQVILQNSLAQQAAFAETAAAGLICVIL